ncbi:ATP-binding protein [Desulfosarcina ovata]|uniref:histidine kinase n=1 Tax=Desulfosarcina ovata subsp. ovata TaxID=2752305 RepID=A0A5K8AG95_9BACT|nr:ATP-binding protein [Desulfosarcina ovata]BBO91529.1 hypothetical protein DSCOOX_47090 [Desulfosarcina ovata subsp. ovata]
MNCADKKKTRLPIGLYNLFVTLLLVMSAPAIAQEHLRIGVPMGFPPFSYQDEGHSEVRGYSVDVLNILSAELLTEPRYLVGTTEDLLRALKNGDLDLVVGIALDENQRQDFSTLEILIYVKRYLFVHHAAETTNHPSQKAIKRVVVRDQPYLARIIGKNKSDFIQARSVKEALTIVNSGQAQEFIDYSDQMATYLIGKYGLQNVRQAGVSMGRFPFTMIIARNNQPLTSGLSKALGEAIKSGQLDRVREKWLGKNYASYLWQRFAPLVVLATTGMAALGLLLFFWHVSLKRKVNQITGRLKVSEERYRQLIESSPDIVFLINKTGDIRLANQSAKDKLQVPEDQLLDSSLRTLVLARDQEKFAVFLKELFSQKIALLETKLTNFGGHLIHVEFVAAKLHRSIEEELLACCFARDLTKRDLMERELIASERLATIGKIAAGVAHEINNPIGIILAHAEDLISGELDNTETQDSLKVIRRNALRAGNITQALLDQASAKVSNQVDLDIAALLEDCLYFLKPRLKKISVIRHLKTERYWLRGDVNQLQQVFINLFLNAIESMSGAGIIRVSVDRIDKGGRDWHRARIEDSGKGIPAHQHQRIFDPFYTQGKFQGVGLGLFVASRIVKNHGGRIFPENSELGGISINVDLPAKTEKKNGTPSADC